MVHLCLSEEASWSHWRVPLSTVHRFTLCLSLICVLFGLAVATKEIHIPYDNFIEPIYNQTRNRLYPNRTAYLTEAVAATDEAHPLYNLYRRTVIRYEFGSSFLNYCRLIKPLNELTMPSLLRTMEMRIDTQVWIRMSVLVMVCVKMMLCLVRAVDIRSHSSVSLSVVSYLSPLLEMATSTMAMLIACLQQEQDRTLKWFMSDQIRLFSILFVAHVILYTFMESFDSRASKSSKLQFRMVFIVFYCACIPAVIESYDDFLKVKPCYTHVPIRSAVMEYLSIGCVVFFNISQLWDFDQLEALFSCEREETQLYHSESDFRPAFAYCDKFKSEKFAPYRPSIGGSAAEKTGIC